MTQKIPETANVIPSDFVIIGGTGHLSIRKILPALFWRFLDKQIDNKSTIILCDKNIKSWDDFLITLKNYCSDAFFKKVDNDKVWDDFTSILKPIQLDIKNGNGHLELLNTLKEKFDINRPIIFYLAIASNLFADSCKFLRDCSLNVSQSRIVIEKPIGKDKLTAIEINDQIYRLKAIHTF